MKTTKMCPQCNVAFGGRSNQLYCSDRCKVEAFRAGKTHKSKEDVIEVSESLKPAVVTNQPSRVLRSATDVSYKEGLKIRRLELEHDRQMRQMELNEEERRRTHERSLAQLTTEAVHLNTEVQKLTKQVNDLTWKAASPLDDWIRYPVGIRRKYQALVQAAFVAVVQSVDSNGCDQWLIEYRAYTNAVQDLIKHNNIPSSQTNAFVWLEELSKKIDAHRFRYIWTEDDDEKLTLDIPNELRQRLTQACI